MRQPLKRTMETAGYSSPLIVAHRGASAYVCENSLEAFELALRQGAQGIETDVQVTRDGIPVILHDARLERTTTGHGLLKEHSFTELKDVRLHNGEPLPALAEVLDFAKGRVRMNLEIKDIAALPRLARLVQERDMEDQVLLSSFDHDLISCVYQAGLHLETAALFGTQSFNPLTRFRELFPFIYLRGLRTRTLVYHHLILLKPVFLRLKELGYKVFVWTVDDPGEMRKFCEWGVAGILTNHPDRLEEVIREAPGGEGQEEARGVL